jgi:hypothetical protein
MDGFGDNLIIRHKSEKVGRQAKEELAVLDQIEAAALDARAKCETALSIIDGADLESVSRQLEEAKKKAAQAASEGDGNQ